MLLLLLLLHLLLRPFASLAMSTTKVEVVEAEEEAVAVCQH